MNKANRSISASLVCLLVLSLSSLGCSPQEVATEQADAEKSKQAMERAVTRVQRKHDQLDTFLNEEEQAVVAAVHDEHQGLLKQWHAEHGEKIRSGRKALVDFMATKDKAKAKQAMAEAQEDNVKELILEEREMQKVYEEAVIAAVPSDKLKLWQADRISRTLLEFLEPLELTDAQIQQVHDLAPSALQKIREKDKPAWHLMGTANLETLFGQRVVSAAQKQPFEKLKDENKHRKLKWSL